MTRPVSVGLNLVANTLTTVYTVPVGYYAKWNLMYLMNGTGSSKHCTVYWSDASTATDIYILNQAVIASKDFLKLDGGSYTVLDEGDTVKMISEAASSYSTICTFELIKKEGI
jgi:hypothetical protein